MEAFERVVVVVAEPAAPMGGSGSSSATAVKSSQPLHNFSLPFLKWGNQTNKNKNTNNSNNNNNNNNNNNSSSSSSRCRKLVDSSSRDFSPSRDRRSSPSEPDSADEEGGGGGGGGYRRGGGRNGSGNGGDGSNSRFSFANCAAGAGTAAAAAMESNGGTEGEELVELVQKPWNLRPRRSAGKAAASEIAAACKNGELAEKIENLPKSGRLRSMAEGHQSVEKEKKKRRLVISLSRDEVDEDFFIMTGSKASRRPKKRPKNIQKLVDSGLPGLWLVGLTADSYSIPDVPAKK